MPGPDAQLGRTRIEPKSVQEMVYERLRSAIAAHELGRGPLRLRDLAATLGVSTTPVREALRRLEGDGLVTYHRTGGIVVNELSAEDVREIFQIRLNLELLALSIALPKLRPEDIRALDRLEAQIERTTNAERWQKLNQEFHLSMYRAAGSPRLLHLIEGLWTAVEPYLRLFVSKTASLEVAQHQHRQMVQELREGNLVALEALLRDHLESTAIVIVTALEAMARPADDR